uniref:RNA polymerase alpha subunit n=1 Tax=Streptosarcina costaricana TaxID=2058783 RepID=UPI00286A4177|nr:RNA polymerase alpha subunit [Streptosarcina costaricana]WKT08940.1 RNA polymerase alpha subunit [Streptosarcina costaricana]
MDGNSIASNQQDTIGVLPYRVECVESKRKDRRTHYGRFLLTPLEERHAKTLDILLRRTLLGGIEGTAFTAVRFEDRDIRDECSAIEGVYETVGVILDNLKSVVLKGVPRGEKHASVLKKGPGLLTAGDIQMPQGVECVDPDQLIATLVQPIELKFQLIVKRGKNYDIQQPTPEDSTYLPMDPVFMPVSRVDSKVCEIPTSLSVEKDKSELSSSNLPSHNLWSQHKPVQESSRFEIDSLSKHLTKERHNAFYMLFLEIETNGSISPQRVLHQASSLIVELMRPLCSLCLEPE